MKPLYLDADQHLRLELDGPSLLVRTGSAAARRFPFSRPTRVVVCGPLEMETAALVECLRRGLAVTFLAADGTPAGAALPARPRQSRFEERLEEFLERHDWQGLYENWRRAAERRQIVGALRSLRLRSRDLRPASAAAAIDRELICRLSQERRDQAVPWLEGLLTALVSERVGELGVSPQVVADRRPGFQLVSDWTALLLWALKAELAASMAAEAMAAEFTARQWRRLVSWFEERRDRELSRAARLLDGFSYWLGGIR
jgi:hypothetical protein